MYDVYVAGVLTSSKDPEESKAFYEAIARVCEEAGFTAYLPHQHTDPETHPDLTPQEVYQRNHEIVAKAKMIIAYVGFPSLGVGTELEIAKSNNTEIILHFSEGDRVSRMARGNPAVKKTITYKTKEEALEKLREFLQAKRQKV